MDIFLFKDLSYLIMIRGRLSFINTNVSINQRLLDSQAISTIFIDTYNIYI